MFLLKKCLFPIFLGAKNQSRIVDFCSRQVYSRRTKIYRPMNISNPNLCNLTKRQFFRAPNVWSAKCLGAKCPRPPIFQGANCPYSQMSRSQMSWVPIVQSANCPGAKCPKRQMSGAKCPGAGWRAPFVSLPYNVYIKL